jgi:hypothetical protein
MIQAKKCVSSKQKRHINRKKRIGAVQTTAFWQRKPGTKPLFRRDRNRHCSRKSRKPKREIDRKKNQRKL